MLDLEQVLRASLDHAETQANGIGSEIIMIGILPTLRTEHFESEWMSANPRYQALDEAVFAARREDLELDISGPDTSTCRCSPTPSPRSPRAPRCSCTCRWRRPISRPAGTPRRRWPDRRWRWARTRRSCSASGSGRRPAPSCSCRPPTPARSSCGIRGCARRCSSASAGSPRSSTCSRRTCGTSRRCCRRPPTRTPRRCWPPARRPGCRRLRLHNGTVYRWNRPGLRRRRRPAAPAGGEPGAAGRAHRRRRAGQRRVLLRRAHRAGRRGPAGVDQDVVRRREGQLRRRAPGRASTRCSTGPASAR